MIKHFLFLFVVMLFFEQNIFSQDIYSDIILCMPMDGNANDYSGYNNNGTLHGATLTTDRFGNANKAYLFSGNSTLDYIEVPTSNSFDTLESTNEITITAWCRIDAWYQNWNVFAIVNKYNTLNDIGWEFIVGNENIDPIKTIAFPTNYPIVPIYYGTSTTTFGNWDFYSATYSKVNGICNVYKNAILLNSFTTDTLGLQKTDTSLFIGFSPAGPDEYSVGAMDELRIYNRALTPLEIQTLYNTPNPLCTNPNNFTNDTINIIKCPYESYIMHNGTIINNNGFYIDSFKNHLNNDSLITIHFSHYNLDTTIIYDTICSNQFYTLPSNLQVNLAGVYIDSFKNIHGCDSIIITNLFVRELPIFNLGNDTTICNNKPLLITYNINNASYLWNDNSTENFKNITEDGTYILHITVPPCPIVSDTINVLIKDCECSLFIPNAFSPNNDLQNDVFKPLLKCFMQIDKYSFKIYNRWGQLVFSSNQIDIGWNGLFNNVLSEVGVYFYYIKYYNPENEKSEILKGDIMLIR